MAPPGGSRRAGLLGGGAVIFVTAGSMMPCMSASGLRARRFADLWLAQWTRLAAAGGPDCWEAVP